MPRRRRWGPEACTQLVDAVEPLAPSPDSAAACAAVAVKAPLEAPVVATSGAASEDVREPAQRSFRAAGGRAVDQSGKKQRELLPGFRVALHDGRQGEVEFVATTGEALVALDDGRPRARPWFEETPREWIDGVWPEQAWADPKELRVCGHTHRLRERKDVADYRHAQRCLAGHGQGMSFAELAEEVGRPVAWVQEAVGRGPPSKPKHLEHWSADGFCEVRYLKGRYHQPGLYERIAQGVDWEQDRVWRVHKEADGNWGLRTVKQCEEPGCGRSLQRVPDSSVKIGPGDSSRPRGTQPHSSWICRKRLDGCLKPGMQSPLGDHFYWWCPRHNWYVCESCHSDLPDKPTSKQIRHWYHGECPALDELVFRVVEDFNLPHPGAAYGGTAQYTIKMNWYPDGRAQVTDHRHDVWTILVSLGSPRVLNVDYARVLMEDGDAILFGTQKHGVPVGPPSQGGRLSLVLMFSPDEQIEKAALHMAGRTVPGFQVRKPAPMASLGPYLGAIDDDSAAAWNEDDLASLCALGFAEVEAQQALEACGGDATAAANLLLGV